jgi:hypothetical protein
MRARCPGPTRRRRLRRSRRCSPIGGGDADLTTAWEGPRDCERSDRTG